MNSNNNNNNDDMFMDFLFEIESFPIAENHNQNEGSDNSDNDSDSIPPLENSLSDDEDVNQPNHHLSISVPDSSSNNSLYDIIQHYQEQQLSNRQPRYTMNPVTVLSDSFIYSNTMMEILQDAMDEQILNEALQASLEEIQPEEKHLLSETGEKNIKHFHYDADVHTTFKECPISMEEFQEGDQLSQLPCEHVFLKDNIMKWLNEECARCPVCRDELDYDTIYVRPTRDNIDNSNNIV